MHEDFWFIKAAVAVICACALVFDLVMQGGFAAEIALTLAAMILAIDARRDRSRDFWHSF